MAASPIAPVIAFDEGFDVLVVEFSISCIAVKTSQACGNVVSWSVFFVYQ